MGFDKSHKDWICDRCELKPKKWKVPYLYLDRNDRIHLDFGNDYRQYFICDNCKKKEEGILHKQGKDDWNRLWRRI